MTRPTAYGHLGMGLLRRNALIGSAIRLPITNVPRIAARTEPRNSATTGNSFDVDVASIPSTENCHFVGGDAAPIRAMVGNQRVQLENPAPLMASAGTATNKPRNGMAGLGRTACRQISAGSDWLCWLTSTASGSSIPRPLRSLALALRPSCSSRLGRNICVQLLGTLRWSQAQDAQLLLVPG